MQHQQARLVDLDPRPGDPVADVGLVGEVPAEATSPVPPVEFTIAVPADVDTRRISSKLGGTAPTNRRQHTAIQPAETVSVPQVAQSSHSQESMPQTETQSQHKSTATPIEQVSQLRTALHDALTRTNELLRTLKRQRKQSRLVETTLQSLKQLQQVA